MKIKLTPRQLQCLNLSYSGKSSMEIALELNVAKRTIDYHLAGIFNKCGTTSRYACMLKAYGENSKAYKIKQEFKQVFTKKEKEIIQLLATTEMHKEIAILLSCSVRTINFHAENIYKKLGVKNEREAISTIFEPII